MNIQEKIRDQRESKRLSQYDMADRLGISQSTYLQIEKGKTDLTLSRLYQIAEALDVSVLSLLTDDAKTEERGGRLSDIEGKLFELQQRLRDKEEIAEFRRNRLEQASKHFTNFLLQRIADRYYGYGYSVVRILDGLSGRVVKILGGQSNETPNVHAFGTAAFLDYLNDQNSSAILNCEFSLLATYKRKAIDQYFMDEIVYTGNDWELVTMIMDSGLVSDEDLADSYRESLLTYEKQLEGN